MKSRRFFAKLWRWNAIVIFLVGVAAIVVLLTALVGMVFDDGTENVVHVAPEDVRRSKTWVGVFERIDGSDILRAPLHLDQEISGSYSEESSAVQNYLFYDPSTAASYWLFSDSATLVASAKELPSRAYTEDRVPVVAFVYEQISRDTDSDRRLTNNDLKTIAVSDGTGKRFTPVLRNVTTLHAAELVNGDAIVIIHETAAKMRAVTIDLATLRIIRDTAVAEK
jgi:hypothetical protein